MITFRVGGVMGNVIDNARVRNSFMLSPIFLRHVMFYSIIIASLDVEAAPNLVRNCISALYTDVHNFSSIAAILKQLSC